MTTRRTFITFAAGCGPAMAMSGCVTLAQLQPNCPITYAPSFINRVGYSAKTYDDAGVRVYYPATDASGDILRMCERFPLVMLIHGDCGGDPYAQWTSLPIELACSGYVVAVTQYGGVLANGDPSVTAPLRLAYHYLRNAWEFHDRLMPEPATAIIGHSYGATLAAQMTAELRSTSAFVSLSGVFGQVIPNPGAAIAAITVPGLYLWNDNDDIEIGASLSSEAHPFGGPLFNNISTPKHGVILRSGNHGDYLAFNTSPRCTQQCSCPLLGTLATDFVTTFLSKYIRPEYAFNDFTYIPNELYVDPASLTSNTAAAAYNSARLPGFANYKTSKIVIDDVCGAISFWQTSTTNGSVFVVPVSTQGACVTARPTASS